MIKSILRKRCFIGMLFGIVALLFSACQPTVFKMEIKPSPSSSSELTYEELLTQTAPAQTSTSSSELTYDEMLTQTAPAQTSTSSSELTYEEMRSKIPPSPVDFRITALSNGIRLDWSPPPVVTISHNYCDAVIYYNIYRDTGSKINLELIATTTDTFYIDKSVLKGTIYTYSVSAVHKGPSEGERTDELSIVFP